jgi:Tol biopolymer transport system component
MYRSPRLSRDEKRVVMAVHETAGATSDVWVLELARGARSRMTSGPRNEWFPAWMPGGDRFFFASTRFGTSAVWEKALGESEVPVTEGPVLAAYPDDVSGDGRFLVFHTSTPRGYDLAVLTLEGARNMSPFLATPFNEVQGRFSPNSRWLAYASDESGSGFQVYVRPFPAASGQQTQISIAGGMQPEWRRDGKELFYISADGKLTAVPVTTDRPTFTVGAPHALFDVAIPEPSPPYQTDYAVTADGRRFLVNTVVDQPTRPALTVILNWTSGLKK